MPDTVEDTAMDDHPVTLPSRAVLAAGAALAITAIGLWAPSLFHDGDTLWHLRAGEAMLGVRTGVSAVYDTAPAGVPQWSAHEWLAQIISALGWRAAGAAGIATVHAIAMGTAVLLLALCSSPGVRTVPWLVMVTLGTGCLLPGYLARPHVLALPFVVAWTCSHLAARQAQRAPRWWLLAVMLVWANLHGGFAFGVALTLGFAGEALIMSAPALRWQAAREWGVFAIGTFACTAMTPLGINGITFAAALVRMPGLSRIAEWAPLQWTSLEPAHLALAGLVLFCLAPRSRPSRTRLLLLGALVVMTVRHTRHQMLLGVVGLLVCADALRARAMLAGAHQRAAPRATAIFAIGALLLSLARIAFGAREIPVGEHYPARALTQIPASLRQTPGFHDYAFGGAVLFSGLQPFIGTRVDPAGDTLVRVYDAMLSGNARDVRDGISRYGFRWALLRPGTALERTLQDQGWRLTYADSLARLLLLQ
jgi:hypothetical protein